MLPFFFDNCPTYPKEINKKFENVYFTCHLKLPDLQQMDQGMIHSFKAQYCRRIMWKVIAALKKNQPLPEINLQESISKILKAWNFDVTNCTACNSFGKAGLIVQNENWSDEEYEDKNDIPFEEILKNMDTAEGKVWNYDYIQIDDFLSTDSEVVTSEIPSESDILDNIKNKTSAINCNEDEKAHDHDDGIKKPLHDDISLSHLIQYDVDYNLKKTCLKKLFNHCKNVRHITGFIHQLFNSRVNPRIL